ncbi:MAG TPA: tetratricopeptide repeat protein [Myxococcales bacterium]|nr:tetratricopeptide repeat protein [Myxococcales bacterium]
MHCFALFLLVAQPVPPPGPPQPSSPGLPRPAEGPAGWRERFDELWKMRDQAGVEKELEQVVQQHLAAEPRSFDANWRLAALYNWIADSKEGDEKAALGKKAWDAADRAVTASPDSVRGHYNGGVGIGLYSEGVGIITALAQGLEGKFRDRILASLRLDKDYNDGAPQAVWGRYFFKLPWPKRDVGEATKVLTEAVRTHPNNLRAKLYLADCYADGEKVEEGTRLIQQILDAKESDDPPEDRRIKKKARNWIEAHGPPNTAQ